MDALVEILNVSREVASQLLEEAEGNVEAAVEVNNGC
jgi:hypothetical protein